MIKPDTLKIVVLFAALAMLLPLPVMQYIGEESWYTMSAYEMFVNHKWWHQTLFGWDLDKPPLFNWLTIAVAEVIGWEHLQIAPRIVSVISTWSSACVVFLMARRLFPSHDTTPWLATLIYLTMGEVFFWYGWLGYADATFGFFIFSAIICLWIAIEDNKLKWFIVSLLLISLAFLVKNFSCYAIYGLSGMVLLHRFQRWHMLSNPLFLALGLLGLTFPWAYQTYFIQFGSSTSDTLIHAMLNFKGFGILDYVYHWISYPLLFIARAFPMTILLIWLMWSNKQRYQLSPYLITLICLLIVCIAPFWVSAAATPRYLIPFYGLFALLLTGLILQLDHDKLKLAFKIMVIIVIIKVPYSFGILPYIKDWRPERDIKIVAEEIMQFTGEKPLRTQNDVSIGLSLAAYINVRTPHDQFIHWYNGKERQVFILTEVEEPLFGKMIKHWRLQGTNAYLYWQQ
ncbi:MAG: glycosyltransferase family 39 protein [Mariprofundus sp.]|nr:glycosyltransferase family 39 protein [Mariprofundus sp.]